MITTRPWLGISSPDWFINSDTPQSSHPRAIVGQPYPSNRHLNQHPREGGASYLRHAGATQG
jgi:hypothetical protein